MILVANSTFFKFVLKFSIVYIVFCAIYKLKHVGKYAIRFLRIEH